MAIVSMMVIEAIGNAAFPPPALDLNNPDAPAVLPFENQLFPVIGWFLATLAGGWLANQISRRTWTAWLVAASVLVGAILDFALGRHDLWVMAAGVAAPLLGAWLARKIPGKPLRLSA